MVISTKLPKEKVVSLIWSFCFNRVLGKVPTNCFISVLTEYALLPFDEGDGNGENMGDGDGDEGGG
jgi:hypothetical protein